MYGKALKNMLRPSARTVFRALSWIEDKVTPEYKLRYSPTFIIAPPRSGSTLLYQLVAYTLSTSYFTYLTGRLRVRESPAIPVFTARLAKILGLVERSRETFENYYGSGRGWGGPSGLEIFDQWFPDRYVEPGELCAGYQQAIYQAVAATERIFDRPFVDKEQKHSVRIQALVGIFPNILFIQCIRDPLAMAQSIFIARTRDFPREWFSAKPKEYDRIKDKGLIEQVCEQVYFIEQNIAADRAVVGEGRFHFVNYRDLCQNPQREINRIAEFMNDHGAPTQIIRPVPDSFHFSSGRKIDKATYLAMADYLEALYGRPMEVDSG
jgi:hypothetical protein